MTTEDHDILTTIGLIQADRIVYSSYREYTLYLCSIQEVIMSEKLKEKIKQVDEKRKISFLCIINKINNMDPMTAPAFLPILIIDLLDLIVENAYFEGYQDAKVSPAKKVKKSTIVKKFEKSIAKFELEKTIGVLADFG